MAHHERKTYRHGTDSLTYQLRDENQVPETFGHLRTLESDHSRVYEAIGEFMSITRFALNHGHVMMRENEI